MKKSGPKQRLGSKSHAAINHKVEQLEKANRLVEQALEEAARVTEDIRNGFQEAVVLFIDLVDSTRFKMEYKDEPEKWILRLMQFSGFLTNMVEEANGKVVKYIGDEVMAIFDQDSKINDALNLVNRIDEINANLTTITGHETKVKIALDMGDVYLVKYDGHHELDPQGTPVDRCARIAKYASPGTIVTSFHYQKYIGKKVITHEIGKVDLKGLGMTPLYQLYENTIKVEEKLEVNKEEYLHTVMELDTFKAQNSELIRMNKRLQKELEEVGVSPAEEDTVIDDDDDARPDEFVWNYDIKPSIIILQNIIGKADVPKNEYGRFLFLYFKDKLGQKYNSFERTFDACIENNLVIDDNGYYILNKDHKLNKQAIKAMDDLEELLKEWEETYPDDDDFHDYDCSLVDPKFWKEWIGVNVR